VALSDARTKLVRRLHRRKTREREGLVLVEGPHAIEEALDADATLRFVLPSPRVEAPTSGSLLARLDAANVERIEVPEDEMRELADTETPQGLLAVVAEPALAWPDDGRLPEGRWLVLDALQDPGNVGTLIRAAAAFGCAGVVAMEGTADPWGTRAVRASAGTLFRLPVHVVRGRDFDDVIGALPHPVLAAEMGGGDPRARTGEAWSLIVGNEGAGIRRDLLDVADARVAVPMPGGVESLNAGVAGAILLYALTPDAT
jgi:TrmH family RNA methyltransferase